MPGNVDRVTTGEQTSRSPLRNGPAPMNTLRRLAHFLFLSLALLPTARADVLVLVHGWASGPDTWITSGVLPALEAHGWSDAGVVAATPAGIQFFQTPQPLQGNRVYRAQMPAEAPLQIQAAHLYAQLQEVQRQHPGEPIFLAGHSAGGVAARLVVIRPGDLSIRTLITIASPNLGTERAQQGLDVAYGKPFFCPGPGIDFLKEMVGGDGYRYLRQSGGALVDLTPAVPGTLLGWLNHQPHPDIRYHAIVHDNGTGSGDPFIPGFSQDLSQVPALRGRVQVHVSPAPHFLNPSDGALLAKILAID